MAREEEVKEIVIARIEATPEGVGVSFGDHGDLSKEQIIEHIRIGDEIGKKIIEVQLNYLRALKEGFMYQNQDV